MEGRRAPSNAPCCTLVQSSLDPETIEQPPPATLPCPPALGNPGLEPPDAGQSLGRRMPPSSSTLACPSCRLCDLPRFWEGGAGVACGGQ